MTIRYLPLIAGLVVAGCSSSGDDPQVTQSSDTGTPVADSSPDTATKVDSATSTDSGSPAEDSAQPETGTSDGGAKTCGGETCEPGQFCNYKRSSACGTVSDEGTCMTPPMICGGVIAQVCGCDGVTYDNACNANSAGKAVKADGACP